MIFLVSWEYHTFVVKDIFVIADRGVAITSYALLKKVVSIHMKFQVRKYVRLRR